MFPSRQLERKIGDQAQVGVKGRTVVYINGCGGRRAAVDGRGRGAIIVNMPGCQDGGVAAWSRHPRDGDVYR